MAQRVSVGNDWQELVEKNISSLAKKSSLLNEKFQQQNGKYLSRLQKQEAKLKLKLGKVDSVLARQLFDGIEEQYAALKDNLPNKGNHFYSGHLDSLSTALQIFKKVQTFPSPALEETLSQFSSLQDKLDQTEVIKKFLSERKRLLKQSLEHLGMLGELKGFEKKAYYYVTQVKEYRALWDDPSQLEKKLLEVVSKTEVFKDFFRKNSQLASLFVLPGDNPSAVSLAGLQTRTSVQQDIVDRFGSGPQVQQLLRENLQEAQGQMNELESKLSRFSSGSFGNRASNIELPEGFKPNGQKTKPFLQRLEYGANVQSQKARSYFPVTSDLGLSLGYKLNDNSSVGIGASYKLGWGKGWNHTKLTHEGVGLRSYMDLRLKGSFFLSGGYEQNYRTAFRTIQQLHDHSKWQASGLIGLSKKYKVSKKLKGEMKLLWDFLSFQQIPKTPALLFRVGYSLK
ncbi:hypothetical protein [Flavisolibacter nicotianae]|uniref:hypothetical protein n=1 Tax=Flavisolibacter nicotianae TaxID=2364882 RepID=UPI000EAE4A72|nr:hypothetical protein [Flavisolibacter nicotianae]